MFSASRGRASHQAIRRLQPMETAMRRRLISVAIVLVLGAGATPALAQIAGGAALFERHCATCHVGADTGRAPTRDALRDRTPESSV